MKNTNLMKNYIFKFFSVFVIAVIMFISFPSIALSNMSNYCSKPPFISSGVKPNLLLMIDNSASMYDLAYVDNGNAPLRESSYCYDQTYNSANTYAGYFDKDSVYTYDFVSGRFKASGFSGSCSHQVSNELCLNIVSGSPRTVDEFTARGNYLNWLSASKLDVQKEILTGGKYDTATNELIPESRGCVGRSFIKEALTADYVEGGLNTSLGLAFSISGPSNQYNPTGVSSGGQTYIAIYEGDYNEVLCQAAIEQINNASNPAAIRKAVEDCLSYDPNAAPGSQYCLLDPARSCSVDSDCNNVSVAGDCSIGKKSERTCLSPASMAGQSCVNDSDCDAIASSVGPCVGGTSHGAEVNSKIVFNQSMQECWQIWSGSKATIGTDAWSGEAPKCEEIYSGYSVCNGGDNDGNTCSSDADCTGGGTCDGGPSALRPGNPAVMCNSTYAGYCATTSDDWATMTWVAQEYSDPEDCFLSKYLEFCNSVKVPPVIDPSDTPDDTAETANIPAIIADIGVEAQLGSPIAEFTVQIYDATPPTGLIEDFSDNIRFGAMDFNFDGSFSECVTNSNLSCPKVCSSTSSLLCSSALDCPSGETCIQASGEKDGGKIINYIGEGTCSASPATTCIRADQCPSGEICLANVGDHSTGLIKSIDDIRAETWTPFAESYYNALAYFVKDASSNLTLDPSKYTAASEAIQEPLNSNDFSANKNPIEYRCQGNNVLIISDGASTADLSNTMATKALSAPGLYDDGDATDSSCGNYSGSSYLDDLSYFGKNRNIFNPLDNDPSDDELSQSITTYVVYTGSDASTLTGECHPKTLMNDTAVNGGTTLYDPADPETLEKSLENVFQKVSSQASSGTASSVIASSEGSGALMEQVVFFPNRKFGNSEVTWTSTLQNLWYYINPTFGGTSIREDTDGDRTLNLSNDFVVKFYFDSALNKTMVSRYTDPLGNETLTPIPPDVEFEKLNNLWEAGILLWNRDLTLNPRKIYTPLNAAAALTDGTNSFDPMNVAALRPLLNTDDISRSSAENDNVATNIINYIKGADQTDYTDGVGTIRYRPRTVAIDLNEDGDTVDIINGMSESAKVWKLGDIISSTPKISSSIPLNKYYEIYKDNSYKEYTKTANYQNRGLVFTGSNDGMLHAFNLGKLEMKHDIFNKAALTGSDLGEEQWAFIPKNVTPYLKYLADPDYCHIYTIDAPSYIFDASIGGNSTDTRPSDGSSWRTILIGGMGQGGACRDTASACTNCVKTPASGLGYSSYFALDITDQNNPSFLWEFSNTKMGFATTGPSLVRINTTDISGNPDKNTNGKWFVVLASGPTGPIDTTEDQFMGRSDQNLNIFIIDLETGNLLRTIDTGIANAFSSTIMNSSFDPDIDYQDDVIHIGYTYSSSGMGDTWTDGGVLRLSTKENTNPANWALSKVIADIGPVTSSVARLVNSIENNMWLYFGSGRYFYQLNSGIDDADSQRSIYGMKDPCYSVNGYDPACTMSITEANLTDVTDISNIPSDPHDPSFFGWKILLDPSDASGFKAERVITDTVSSTTGAVYFTTLKPSADMCGYGGKTHIWAVDYGTGGSVEYALKGKVSVQLSTGSIEEKNLATAFTEKNKRRSSSMDGVPPKYQGLTLLTMPKPKKKVVHMRER